MSLILGPIINHFLQDAPHFGSPILHLAEATQNLFFLKIFIVISRMPPSSFYAKIPLKE